MPSNCVGLILPTMIVIIGHVIVNEVCGFYLPRNNIQNIMRRQDDDSDGDDEMYTRASSPGYQDDRQNADGYEDNEPDGPYGETPRDEEGQADLERFFDDHLGASEKEGMDKENLPTNIVPILVPLRDSVLLNKFRAKLPAPFQGSESSYTVSVEPKPYLEQQLQVQPSDVETRYIKLPDNKLIITRQSITRGPVYKGGLDLPEIPPIPKHFLQTERDSRSISPSPSPSTIQDQENLYAKGSEIIATENDDFDKVYVTRDTKRPFRIEALGGYDPEEDFHDAARDIEDSSTSTGHRKRGKKGEQPDSEESLQKDISFNDPEPEVLFNDASETDEVTFGPNDEHDLEAEMYAQAYNVPGKPTQFTRSQPISGPSSETAANEPRAYMKPRNYDNDNDEGNWVNDGVEDMEIPSQPHQDKVLAKAEKQEELARRAAEDEAAEAEAEASQQDDSNQQDTPEGQRMANADYMKNDLAGIDEPDDAGYI